jgi:hypothetical protein
LSVRERLQPYMLAWRRIGPPIFLGVLPAAVLVLALVVAATGDDSLAVDFHHELYPQANLVLDGEDPYPPPDADLSDGTNTIWPIAAVALVAPLAPLPAGAADALMTALVIASLAAALLVVGVRDWRIFGAVALWPATLNAIQTANLTLPLCLLAALVWRLRRHAWAAGVPLGAALGLKFFLWPLVVWLVAVRRWAAAALACGLAAASLLLILPFYGLDDYARLVSNLSDTFDGVSYTVYALLVDVGVPDSLAKAVNLAVGLVVLGLAWRRRSFGLAVGAALVLSPIVWLHFFALLALPLALAWPRFSGWWLLPLALWFVPGTYNGRPWQTALALGVAAATVVVCERRSSVQRVAEPVPLAART